MSVLVLQFQFHKGTIKTPTGGMMPIINLHFNSIKVRLKHDNVFTGRVSAEFQFHKGTIKTGMIVMPLLVKLKFQFHKGTIKTPLVTLFNISTTISIP